MLYYKEILDCHRKNLKSSEFTLWGYIETYNEVVVYNLYNNAFHNSKNGDAPIVASYQELKKN